MAYNRRYNSRKKFKAKKKKFTELERMAYNLGKVNRGLHNTDSRVYASYQNGLKGKTTRNKKPLI